MTVTVNAVTLADDPQWTIDELSSVVGLPTRTIREYRTQGLLQPPHMRGRVGTYGSEHRRRLEWVRRLQERGYSLAGMRDLLAAREDGKSLDDLVDIDTIGSGLDEPGTILATEQLEDRLPSLAATTHRRAAERAGLIERVGDAWCVKSPSLLSFVASAVDAGASIESAIAVVAGLRDGAASQAAAVADMFVGELWDERSAPAMVPLARQARVLLAQSAAALLIEQLARELVRRAQPPGGAGLDKLVEQLRIGQTRSTASVSS